MPQVCFENIKKIYDAEFFFWHIVEDCDELSELIADSGVLFAEAQKKFKSTSRQREWLATRALLQQTPYKGQTIFYHANGQPYLENRHISVSHTRDYVAIAISENPIGIDIEHKGRNALAITNGFLQQQELDNITAEEALGLWVTKEAAFKYAPEKAAILKEIHAVKDNGGYSITYPDGTTAICSVSSLGDIILSFCVKDLTLFLE